MAPAAQETKTPALKWAYEFGQNLYYLDTCATDQVGAVWQTRVGGVQTSERWRLLTQRCSGCTAY